MKKEIYISRKLERTINSYLYKKEIIAIVGPRQCGKTTLMQHIFKKLKDAIFINFEDRKILELFDNDIDSFIEKYVKNNAYLFIDEFQYSREGGKKLKYIYDNYKIKILISGSSASELSIQSIKYLVGRIFVFTLYPLSFSEFLEYKDYKLYKIYEKSKKFSEVIITEINKLYFEFLNYGGYPRVVLSKSKEEKETVLRNIYNIYLLKEIKEILGLKEDYKLSKLIHSLTLQIGGLINYNELALISGFDYKELLSHINILKKTFIISESKPFFTNKRTELSKNPKIFFIDNGFRNTIINNFQDINNRTDKGYINENFISSELIKKEVEVRYWRTKSKAEIDFVIEKNGKILPIEIKSDIKDKKITKAMYSFIEKYKSGEAFVLSESLEKEMKISNVKIIFRPLFSIEKILEMSRTTD